VRVAVGADRASLSVLRARQWLHFLVLPAAGLAAPPWGMSQLARFSVGAVVAALALGWAYGLNAISDRATDIDPRKNPVAGAATSPSSAVAAVCLAGLGALAVAWLAGVLVPAAVSLLAATIYSIGPRLKGHPLIGTLLNAAIFAPLLAFAHPTRVPATFPVEASLFVALLLQNQLRHEQADALEDARARVVTTARWLGGAWTRVVVALIAVVAAGATVALQPSTPVACAAALSLAGGTCAALVGDDWARLRRRHRVVAFVGGALVHLAGWW
jgi:4-hydroxybenzoate polyprenyltransferase